HLLWRRAGYRVLLGRQVHLDGIGAQLQDVGVANDVAGDRGIAPGELAARRGAWLAGARDRSRLTHGPDDRRRHRIPARHARLTREEPRMQLKHQARSQVERRRDRRPVDLRLLRGRELRDIEPAPTRYRRSLLSRTRA